MKKLLVIPLLTVILYFTLPFPVDWGMFYLPAIQALLRGGSPYQVESFFNAPWILLPLLPLALLPFQWGVAVLGAFNLTSLWVLIQRFHPKVNAVALFFLSLPAITVVLFGQIDALVLLGLMLPKPIGVLLLLAKPQLGVWVCLFWLWEMVQGKQWKQILVTFTPAGIAFALSFLIYGLWIINPILPTLVTAHHNTSMWPGAVIIGVPFLLQGFRTRQLPYILIATPLLSPYIGPQSWIIALLGLVWLDLEIAWTGTFSVLSWWLLVTKLI